MVAIPPIARTPWVANLASSANSANDARISTTAAKRVGKRLSAKTASRMNTMPTVPGTTAPGWLNSA